MRRLLSLLFTFVTVLLLAEVCPAQGERAVYGYNLNGEPVTSLASSGVAAVVLFFAATDCPLSNRYLPEIRRIEQKFYSRHIVVWIVYPNFGETSVGVKQHEAAYGVEDHVLLDPNHQLVALAHAKVTPESAVLIPETADAKMFRTVYHGRVDDRYLRLGLEKPIAAQHDLERAIEAALQKRAVEQPGGPAVGCGIIGRP
ncbi:redoxin domain-containing protein [Granulicella sp. S190]|uniref:redoxin domain-containing protein n=1 Tax=Granulicella sp. S190 TaxID=1747226 RepID=UPI00131C2205|nr:redoxin domain-containing protein [Granulicella sp. S190]